MSKSAKKAKSAAAVVTRNARSTGLPVSLFKAEDLKLDPADGPWATRCDEHGTVEQYKTRKAATAAMSQPAEWCMKCFKAAEIVEPEPAPEPEPAKEVKPKRFYFAPILFKNLNGKAGKTLVTKAPTRTAIRKAEKSGLYKAVRFTQEQAEDARGAVSAIGSAASYKLSEKTYKNNTERLRLLSLVKACDKSREQLETFARSNGRS